MILYRSYHGGHKKYDYYTRSFCMFLLSWKNYKAFIEYPKENHSVAIILHVLSKYPKLKICFAHKVTVDPSKNESQLIVSCFRIIKIRVFCEVAYWFEIVKKYLTKILFVSNLGTVEPRFTGLKFKSKISFEAHIEKMI